MTVAHMSHRTDIIRPATHGLDAWGQDAAADPVLVAADQRCFAWSRQRKEFADDKAEYALVEDLRVQMPLHADLRERDTLSEIRDRLSKTLIPGPLRVDTVQHRHDHLEAGVTQVAGAGVITLLLMDGLLALEGDQEPGALLLSGDQQDNGSRLMA